MFVHVSEREILFSLNYSKFAAECAWNRKNSQMQNLFFSAERNIICFVYLEGWCYCEDRVDDGSLLDRKVKELRSRVDSDLGFVDDLNNEEPLDPFVNSAYFFLT